MRVEATLRRADVPIRRYWLVGIGGCAALASVAVESVAEPARSSIVVGLALLGIAASGLGMREKISRALPRLVLDANLLIAVAVIGICLLGKWSEAAVVAWLFAVLTLLEALALDRPRDMIRRRLALNPLTAMVIKPDKTIEAHPISAIAVGHRIRVLAGMHIPVDGRVTSGRCLVDQTSVTGEQRPVEMQSDDLVFAGSRVEQGTVEIAVTAGGDESLLARNLRAVEEALASRTPSQQIVDRLMRVYIPIVVGIALATALGPPLLSGESFSAWSYRALVLLVVACPFALSTSVPTAIASALAAAVHRGVLVRDGARLEALRRLKVVAFAKAGILTEGRPRVSDVVSVGSASARGALVMAAALSSRSDHPLSAATSAQWAAGDDIWPLPTLEGVEALAGRGVCGYMDGRKIVLGNPRYVAQSNAFPPGTDTVLARLEAEGKTTLVLARDGIAIAVIAAFDAVRRSGREAVDALRALDVKTVLLSGDNVGTAEVVGRLVGIDHVRAELRPDQKIEVLTSLANDQHTVGMVADDTPEALTRPAAGITFAINAIGSGIADADVTLMGTDLRKVPELIVLSRRLRAILVQNIAIAFGVKLVLLVLLVLTFAGAITLSMAIATDLAASAIVVANGRRLLRVQESRRDRPLEAQPTL